MSDLRSRLLRVAVTAGLLTVLATEAAGVARVLDATVLRSLWAAAVALAAIAGGRLYRGRAARRAPNRGDAIAMALNLSTAVILAATLLLAIAAPPNTWDAMTYHLPRVEHWLQNGSLAVYATPISRQLTQPPGAEILVLQLRALTGGDRLANLPQWLALAGCAVAASLLAARFGGGRRAQALAALFTVTVPMAVVQASSAKNDLVVAFWLLCFAAFLTDPERSRLRSSWCGAALGLAFLTKLTGYIYGAALTLVLVALAGDESRRRRLTAVLGIGILAAAVNAGHMSRMVTALGRAGWNPAEIATTASSPAPRPGDPTRGSRAATAPAPPASGASSWRLRIAVPSRYVNQVWDPPAWISNLIRNAALHLGTPSAAWNDRLSRAIAAVHRSIRAPLDDPSTTYPGSAGYRGVRFSLHEDDVGNPLHFLLVAAAAALTVARRRTPPVPRRYAAALLVAALGFCVALKWQPWHSRLHLPLFLLAAPVVGVLLGERLGSRGAALSGALLVGAALPVLVAGSPRPLLGEASVLASRRDEQIFRNRPDLEAGYRGAVAELRARDCWEVGLVLGGNDWEYPLWPLLRATFARTPRLEHVDVSNFSRYSAAAARAFRPCALFATRRLGPGFPLPVEQYVEARRWGPVALHVAVGR